MVLSFDRLIAPEYNLSAKFNQNVESRGKTVESKEKKMRYKY